MYELMDNVNIPKLARPTAKRLYPLDKMSVGQMFFVPDRTKNDLATYVSAAGRRLRRKFSTRLCTMKPSGDGSWVMCDPSDRDAVQGIGVWRTA